jgi:hypothetical protein
MSLPTITETGGLRRFADAEVQAAVDRALAQIPPDKRGAVLEVGADLDGVQAVAAVRLDGGWSLMGVLERRFSGEWYGFARVRWAG